MPALQERPDNREPIKQKAKSLRADELLDMRNANKDEPILLRLRN